MHKYMQFIVLLTVYFGMIPNHFQQTRDAKAKGDVSNFARAGVETIFEILGAIFTLLDWSLLGGGIAFANLTGWGGFIHIVILGQGFQENLLMWIKASVCLMFAVSEPWSSRTPRKTLPEMKTIMARVEL